VAEKLQISCRYYFRIGWAESHEHPVPLSAIFVRLNHRTMVLVFISVIGFFGVFFWQAARCNEMVERQH
jgi:hypothetical protein